MWRMLHDEVVSTQADKADFARDSIESFTRGDKKMR